MMVRVGRRVNALESRESLSWELSESRPNRWGEYLMRTEGGFFQSPLGVFVGAPKGRTIYCVLRSGHSVHGIALGVLAGCRLSTRLRHAYFPSLPAIHPPGSNERALDLLIDALDDQGAADVHFDSFDAGWELDQARGERERVEFLVSLEDSAAEILCRFGSGHRRRCRLGEREAWRSNRLVGEDGRAILDAVMGHAVRRAHDRRGQNYAVSIPELTKEMATSHRTHSWGAWVTAAYAGEQLLAAALVGVGGERGFYVMGGSTPEGYRCGAAIWLQYQIMKELKEIGCTEYNLGGTPIEAADASSPGHGLYRFKSSFGGARVSRRGRRAVLCLIHASAHRLGAELGRVLR